MCIHVHKLKPRMLSSYFFIGMVFVVIHFTDVVMCR
jgi:hypothetical protein